MISKFIKNTNNRYSITSDGVVISHYRFKNNGQIYYRDFELKANKNLKDSKTLCVNIVFKDSKRMKSISVPSLMIDAFGIKKPDTFHFYDIDFKDGDQTNNSLSNLYFKIRTKKNYEFYPQPFYDKKKNIVSKICGLCGENKNISSFTNASENTYRNECEKCRSKEQYDRIKSDETRLKRLRQHTKKFANSEKGKKYHKEYRVKYSKYEKENMTDHYISTILKIKQSDLTDTLRELQKKKLSLYRQVFNN